MAVALEDDWELLAAAPTPTAAAPSAASAAATAKAAAAELMAAKKEAAALRAELALTRAQLLSAEQRTFSAEQESTRLTALNTQQRHTITQLANQLALVTAAAAAPADATVPAAAAAPGDSEADATSAPLSPVASADQSRAATLRSLRRAAKARKHQFKAKAAHNNPNASKFGAVQQPKQRIAGRAAS